VDFTDNKKKLAIGLSNFAINRLQSLPPCTEPPTQIDPFSAACSPPNIDYEAERLKIEQQILNEAGFLDDPVITQDMFFSDNDNSNFNEDYSQFPTYYSLIKSFPIYISLILLSLALIVIFASSTKKIGIRKIGRGLVGAGISLIFFTVIFSFVLPQFSGSLPIFQSSGAGVDSLFSEISIVFGQDYAWMIIKICHH
jgi:hypothetical protein